MTVYQFTVPAPVTLETAQTGPRIFPDAAVELIKQIFKADI